MWLVFIINAFVRDPKVRKAKCPANTNYEHNFVAITIAIDFLARTQLSDIHLFKMNYKALDCKNHELSL